MFKTIHCRGKIRDVTWYRRMYSHRDMILKVAWQRRPDNTDAINIAERLARKDFSLLKKIEKIEIYEITK